ncbi:MAG: ABC transporter permease [Candidatus Tectimicrobiota bacterium]|nr:MAG: ABC transporter permease [Candidatus Tectomicrobia bacterium]
MGGRLWRGVPLLVLALLWEGLTRGGLLPPEVLPPLDRVLERWAAFWWGGDLLPHLVTSLWREATGFSLSVAVGVPLGIGMAWVPRLRRACEPLLALSYPVPKQALIPVFMLWLGIGHASKIAVIFVGCLIPVVISSLNGARGVDPYLLWSATNLGTPRHRLLWRVIVPAALPDILGGIRMALSISFILLVTSEILAARAGLGYLCFFLGESGAYEEMFAVVLTVVLLGFGADRLYVQGMRRLLVWHLEEGR